MPQYFQPWRWRMMTTIPTARRRKLPSSTRTKENKSTLSRPCWKIRRCRRLRPGRKLWSSFKKIPASTRSKLSTRRSRRGTLGKRKGPRKNAKRRVKLSIFTLLCPLSLSCRCVQSWLKYKASVTKITGTPPTAQTPGPNWLIFWLEAPHLIVFGRTEAIFEFRIWGWDIGPFSGPEGPIREFRVGPISPPQIRNSKIASVRPNTIRWGAYSQNMSQFGPGVWAVGGVPAIWGRSPCILITSVQRCHLRSVRNLFV